MAKRDPIKWYNDIMYSICRDEVCIGEGHTGTTGWNLRDMVSEMRYVLDQYEDPDCIYYEEAHDEAQPSHKPWYKEWIAAKARMRRFIETNKKEALQMECTESHCSRYD